MNRRKALASLALLGGSGLALLSGKPLLNLFAPTDIEFLQSRLPLLSALAETIIPATETPGASEAGVGNYILLMIKDCTDKQSANNFVDGVKELEAFSQKQWGKPYTLCPEEAQHSILAHFEKKGEPMHGIAGKIERRLLGKSFFSLLKEYTVTGYCTSQLGATQAMAYDLVPGLLWGRCLCSKGKKHGLPNETLSVAQKHAIDFQYLLYLRMFT